MSKSHTRTSSSSSSTSASSLYKFIPSQTSPSSGHTLTIRQQPVHARVCTIPERDRRPIDPPPILRMSLDALDPEEEQYHTQSPHYFMCANLVHSHDHTKLYLPVQNYLTGTIVSSLHRLKDIDNTDGAFFVFGDLAVKEEGEFRLLFSLFEIEDTVVRARKTILSDVFTVYAPRHFPGPLPSTFLSRSFSDQGVRMRIRKEHRIQVSSPRKRKQAEPEKPYGKRRLQSSPLSDDAPSEASVTMDDRKVDSEKPYMPQQRDPSKEHTREYLPTKEFKSEYPTEQQLREYPDYQRDRPRDYSSVYHKEQPHPTEYLRDHSRGTSPALPFSSVPLSKTSLPDISTLPNPIHRSSPFSISIHREPIMTFPLFHQVMPDIAQYHLGASKPATPPESLPDISGEPMSKQRQDTCRPGPVDSPFDSRFDSRLMNPPSHPLFP